VAEFDEPDWWSDTGAVGTSFKREAGLMVDGVAAEGVATSSESLTALALAEGAVT
jgi:hypothetical protein